MEEMREEISMIDKAVKIKGGELLEKHIDSLFNICSVLVVLKLVGELSRSWLFLVFFAAGGYIGIIVINVFYRIYLEALYKKNIDSFVTKNK